MFGKAKAFLFEEDRGVSPVIGVILMVAITVILAAVIATFVMNMGPSSSGPANSNLEWNNQSGYVNITMTGGEPFPVNEYKLEIKGSSNASKKMGNVYSAEEMTAGDVFSIGIKSTSGADWAPSSVSKFSNIEEIQLIWKNPDNGQTQIVDTFEP